MVMDTYTSRFGEAARTDASEPPIANGAAGWAGLVAVLTGLILMLVLVEYLRNWSRPRALEHSRKRLLRSKRSHR
jgi:hypothetical protein